MRPTQIVGIVGNAGRAVVNAESLALFARMTAQPSDDRKAAISALITSLKAGGVWAKLKALQIYAAADSQAASLNWVTNAGNASLINSPNFVVDRWIAGNASTSYINTNCNPNSLGCSQNSMTIAVWNSGPYGSGAFNVGWPTAFSNAAGIDIQLSATASERPVLSGQINKSLGSYYTSATLTGNYTHGLIALVRSSAEEVFHSIRGVTVDSASSGQTSTGLHNANLYLGAGNNAGSPIYHHDMPFSAFVLGDALSASELLSMSNALDSYMQSLGNYRQPFVMWGDSQSVNATWRQYVWRASALAGRPARRGVVQGVSAESATAIRTRMIADTAYHDHIQIIWVGRNNISNGSQVVDKSIILSEVAAMVAAAQARSGKFVVMPPCKGNIDAGSALVNSEAPGTTIGLELDDIKSTLSARYGSNFLDIEQKLIDWATAGNASVISGTAPTANDIADAGVGVTPRGLLGDDIHKNNAGNTAIGYYVEQHLNAQGM